MYGMLTKSEKLTGGPKGLAFTSVESSEQVNLIFFTGNTKNQLIIV